MSHQSATLLLVDDDAMNRDALSRRLVSKGYDVLIADSGPSALDLVSSRRVDAVLLDVMMPGMSGLETLRRLRQSRSVSELPVIMVTAKQESTDVVEALELGANDYITKPIDFPIALARIRTQISSRRADPLTGLPNRAMFMERLGRSFARTGPTGEPTLAVFFLDVDRFKYVNDSLGHLAGDELLVALSRRLESVLRATDVLSRFNADATLARLGGDEFTILLDGVRSVSDAAAIAERLLSVLVTPFTVQGHELYASLSIGIVLGHSRYRRAEDMIRDADTAMYRAKANGKSRYEIFDVSMLEAAAHRLQIESELRKVLERRELKVYYQPIVSTRDQRLLGFEALVRWLHPERGMILPTEFIAIAEDTGLIVPIGDWVLRQACAQMRAWQLECPGSDALIINVNSSPRQLLRQEFVREVATILADVGLAPECLKLEITEGVMVENPEMVFEILTELRALGVQLGLDDFGMGYSGLGYLRRFPFQTLKIDRSFISGIHESGNTEIIRAIVAMAEGLSMNVTAEGVETAEQLVGLQRLDCDSVQGFYFAKALPPDEARAMWLSAPPHPQAGAPKAVSVLTSSK